MAGRVVIRQCNQGLRDDAPNTLKLAGGYLCTLNTSQRSHAIPLHPCHWPSSMSVSTNVVVAAQDQTNSNLWGLSSQTNPGFEVLHKRVP